MFPIKDELDQHIALVGKLAKNPPKRDPIEAALQIMATRLEPQLYLALYTSDATEVSGAGYARQPYRDEIVKFPPATGTWGTITGAVIYDENDVPVADMRFTHNPVVGPGDNLQVHLDDTTVMPRVFLQAGKRIQ